MLSRSAVVDEAAALIRADIAQARFTALSYLKLLRGGHAAIAGRQVLELAPSPSLGSAVLLAAYGASVTVATKEPITWRADYHPAFYQGLLVDIITTNPGCSQRAVLELLSEGDFTGDRVRQIPLSRAGLSALPASRFDLVVSTSALEHVKTPGPWLAELARLTCRGGVGIHEVDFSDHRDSIRPLEYLTLSNEAFARVFAGTDGGCGNRVRHRALTTACEAAGFDVTSFTPMRLASDDYLRGIRSRLHADCRSLKRDELQVLTGLFQLRRS